MVIKVSKGVVPKYCWQRQTTTLVFNKQYHVANMFFISMSTNFYLLLLITADCSSVNLEKWFLFNSFCQSKTYSKSGPFDPGFALARITTTQMFAKSLSISFFVSAVFAKANKERNKKSKNRQNSWATTRILKLWRANRVKHVLELYFNAFMITNRARVQIKSSRARAKK